MYLIYCSFCLISPQIKVEKYGKREKRNLEFA